MGFRKWLLIAAAACMLLNGGALAEDAGEVPAENAVEVVEAPSAEDVQAPPVEDDVDEVSMTLGGGDELPEPPAEDEEEDAADWAEFLLDADWDGDYELDWPDVTDENLRRSLRPSERVYPGTLLWPLPGKEPLGSVTSHVGWRNADRIHKRQGGAWASWLHHGIDVGGVDSSQAVVAAASGTAYAGRRNGIGYYVVIDHGDGWYTRVQHLSRFAGAVDAESRGVPVEAGDVIGYVGNSGGDYPVHFHFEIAWSPDGGGGDDADYQRETHNRKIKAYSFPQQGVVEMHWAKTWEICTAENQTFIASEIPEAAVAVAEAEQ